MSRKVHGLGSDFSTMPLLRLACCWHKTDFLFSWYAAKGPKKGQGGLHWVDSLHVAEALTAIMNVSLNLAPRICRVRSVALAIQPISKTWMSSLQHNKHNTILTNRIFLPKERGRSTN